MKSRKILFLLMIILTLLSFSSWAKPSEKPIIGIMLNSGSDKSYSLYPWYAIRKNYGQIIAEMGGIPVFIGHDPEILSDYLNFLDGIVLTGGDFNSPEEAYTTGIKDKVDPARFPREYIEFELVHQAYAKDIPLLGICAGMQNMNVAMGGTLHKNLKEALGTNIEHHNEIRNKPQHRIQIAPNTKLHKITKTTKLEVNSNHHEGINRVAPVFIVNAVAPDGVIEGIEAPQRRFFLGVIWHPEFLLSSEEKALWKSFIHQALLYHQKRKS